MDLRIVTPFAQRHHGLLRRSDAAQLGISKSAWYRAVDSGLLEPLYPNVARLPGAMNTLPQRALAAVWAVGHGALASHRTSAALWGIDRPEDEPIEVLLSSRERCVTVPGVVVHRPRDLVDLRPIDRGRVPTTMPVRMLLDLGAVDPDAVLPAALDLLSRRVVSPAGLRSGLMRHARRGRSGVTAFRSVLDQLGDDRSPADTVLETEMASLLRKYRLPPAVFHPVVVGYEVDFMIDDSIIILECDGWESHGLNRNQFEFDRVREADLTAAGYVVVHFTWSRVVHSPRSVAEQIRGVVRQWAPHLTVGR